MRVPIALVTLACLYFLPGIAMSETENSVPIYMPLKVGNNHILFIEVHSDVSIPKKNVDAVINAITSTESFEQDGQLYYYGWKGTLLDSAKNQNIPQPLAPKMVDSTNSDPDVIIVLTNSQSDQGYSGLTTFVTEYNMIKKSHITIYEAKELTTTQISAIARHEFGHALGLGHSTVNSDLMYPSFTVATAFISQLDEKSIGYIYDQVTDNSGKGSFKETNQQNGNEASVLQLQQTSSVKSTNSNFKFGSDLSTTNSTTYILSNSGNSLKFVSQEAVPEFQISPVILILGTIAIILFYGVKTRALPSYSIN